MSSNSVTSRWPFLISETSSIIVSFHFSVSDKATTLDFLMQFLSATKSAKFLLQYFWRRKSTFCPVWEPRSEMQELKRSLMRGFADFASPWANPMYLPDRIDSRWGKGIDFQGIWFRWDEANPRQFSQLCSRICSASSAPQKPAATVLSHRVLWSRYWWDWSAT